MLIALAFSAAALLAQSSAQRPQSAATEAALHEAVNRLAAESPDIVRAYEELASEPLESRKHLFAALPSSMKSAVWVHHLLRAVTTHPEFTAEQKSVIYDGIRLLSPELYEPGSAATREAVHELTLRAQLLFSRDVALRLFVEIGSDIPFAEGSVELNRESANRTEGDKRASPKRDEKSQHPIRPMAVECGCSVYSDWCYVAHGYGWTCHFANCTRVDYACGSFSNYTCDGLCVKDHDPDA